MCRSNEDPRFYHTSSSSSSSSRRRSRRRRDRLNIGAFYLRFESIISSSSSSKTQKENPMIPNSLTLHYLPRISGSPLYINDAPIPSDFPAFVTLYRVTSSNSPLGEEGCTKEAVFASREQVRASEGVRFEVYWREEKVLKGVFRRKDYDYDYDDNNFIDFTEEWKVDCKCAVESHVVGVDPGLLEISDAEVCIVIEDDGHRVMMSSDKVEMAVGRRNKKKKNRRRGFVRLEEIPEVREVDDDDNDDSVPDDDSSSSSCCCCGGGSGGGDLKELRSDGGVDGEASGDKENQGLEMEMEMEGVKWAVDVGIWVMCLGVGYLVSRASSNSLRRRPRRSFFF